MTCEYCEQDDDNVRGIYVCPHCGSPEMVDKANEPNGEAVDKKENELKKKELADLILSKQKDGRLIYFSIDTFMEADLKNICFDQPVEGLLWDLNRDLITCLTLVKKSDDIVWVNNAASGIVIEYLRNSYDDLLRRLYEAKCEVETSILETDLSYRKGLLHTLTIFRKHFPELEDK